MIDIKDANRFLEVLSFAVLNNCADKLVDRLEYLANYGNGNCIVELHNDHAPHSFAFVMKHSNGNRWFNGGLIYSGPGQPLDGSGPAFTVSLAPTGHEHNWSVHT
jgi:hypothetical protein